MIRITNKEFNEVKNKLFVVISFHQNGKRALTYGRCSAFQALKEVMLKSQRGMICKVYREESIPAVYLHNNIEDYADFQDIESFGEGSEL